MSNNFTRKYQHTYTLGTLITELQSLAEEHGEDTPVALAHQPNYPFELSIGQVIPVEFDAWEINGDDEEPGDTLVVVYLAEEDQLGYLPGNAQEALGW